jgi:DNA-directed RNA polymerase specialized sigma24 family protein
MDIPDGDLVRLARDGDPAAFRLLVERHLPMARARAARLCPQPDDADDAVQDAFLQAFIALDRLRDPDRFAGWLGGILANVCRAQRRRAPLTLLGDWPENLHPASADDYRGRAVVFRGDLRATDVADRAGLVLRVTSEGRLTPQRPAGQDPWHDPGNHFAFVTGTRDWTRHEVTAQIPPDAILIIFGVFLTGRGQIELRNPELQPHPANQQQQPGKSQEH